MSSEEIFEAFLYNIGSAPEGVKYPESTCGHKDQNQKPSLLPLKTLPLYSINKSVRVAQLQLSKLQIQKNLRACLCARVCVSVLKSMCLNESCCVVVLL